MNSIQFTAPELEAWSAFAEIAYREAREKLRSDGEFQELVARTLERENDPGRPDFPVWDADDCARSWLSRNPPEVTDPPVPMPVWATTRKLSPTPDGEGIDWTIIDQGMVGAADLTRHFVIGPDGSPRDLGVTINIEADKSNGEERLCIDSSQVDKVIATLNEVRQALNA